MNTAKKIAISLLVIIISAFSTFYLNNYVKNKQEAKIYFIEASNNQNHLIPVKRQIKNSFKLQESISELLKGPNALEKQSGLVSEIPQNTKILNINENKNGLYINLSKDFESGGGSESMSLRLKQLVYTAVDNSEKKSVYLEIDGKKAKYIGGEGVEVPLPFDKKSLEE